MLQPGDIIPAKIVQVRGNIAIASVFQTFGAEINLKGELSSSVGDMITFKCKSVLEDTNTLVFRGSQPQPYQDTITSNKEIDFLSLSQNEDTLVISKKCADNNDLPSGWSKIQVGHDHYVYVAPNGDIYKDASLEKALSLHDSKQRPKKYGFTKTVMETRSGVKKISYVSGETTYYCLEKIYNEVLKHKEKPIKKNSEASDLPASLPKDWSEGPRKSGYPTYISPSGEVYKYMYLQKALRLHDFKQQPEKYGFVKKVKKFKSGKKQVYYVSGKKSYGSLKKLYNKELKKGNFKTKLAETTEAQPPKETKQKSKRIPKQQPKNLTPVLNTTSKCSRTPNLETEKENEQVNSKYDKEIELSNSVDDEEIELSKSEEDKEIEQANNKDDKENEQSNSLEDKEIELSNCVDDKETELSNSKDDKENEQSNSLEDKEYELTNSVDDKDIDTSNCVEDKEIELSNSKDHKEIELSNYVEDKENEQPGSQDKDEFSRKFGFCNKPEILSEAEFGQSSNAKLSKSFKEKSKSEITFKNVDKVNKSCQNLEYVEQNMDSSFKISENSDLNNETNQMISDFSAQLSENANDSETNMAVEDLDCTEKLLDSVNKTVDIASEYVNKTVDISSEDVNKIVDIASENVNKTADIASEFVNISINTSAILSTNDIDIPCRQGARKRFQSTPCINKTAKRARRSSCKSETELPDEVGIDIANENQNQQDFFGIDSVNEL